MGSLGPSGVYQPHVPATQVMGLNLAGPSSMAAIPTGQGMNMAAIPTGQGMNMAAVPTGQGMSMVNSNAATQTNQG